MTGALQAFLSGVATGSQAPPVSCSHQVNCYDVTTDAYRCSCGGVTIPKCWVHASRDFAKTILRNQNHTSNLQAPYE